MMNFEYCNTTRVIFGKGTRMEVGQRIKPYGRKVLLHYGGGSIKETGLYDAVASSLENAGIAWIELGGARPNPRLSLVREGVELCRREGVDFILAVGGGSTIDSAKAIALGVPYEGDVWDYWETKKQPEAVLPVATILTLPAAGSETSIHSVITNEETGRKFGYRSEKIRPLFSIIDPELFYTLPANQIANGVCDMMSHVMERYFTNSLHVDLTDSLCEGTLKTIMRNGLKLVEDKEDYDAWAEVAFAGSLAHNGFLELGRVTDWASHRMEHELSAAYDVAHGAGLAVMTPAWMRYVYKDNVDMFVQFAVNVMGVSGSFREKEALALAGIDRLEAFFLQMGLPVRLGQLGIGEDQLEAMAKKATGYASGKEQPVGGLKKLGWQDVLAIYRMAL